MFQILDNLTTYCSESGVATVFYVMRIFILILQIVVPALLIVSASISLMGLTFSPDDQKKKKKLYNKFIAALIIFFLPFFVNLALDMINNAATSKDTYNMIDCWSKSEVVYKTNTNKNTVDDKSKNSIYNECVPLSSYKNDQGDYDYAETCEKNPRDNKWYECLDTEHNCFDGGIKGTGISQSVIDKINDAINKLKEKLGKDKSYGGTGSYTSDQASTYTNIGTNAYNEGGSTCTYRKQVIEILLKKVESVQSADNINMSNKYLIAKCILETGWLHPTWMTENNNLYGMNVYYPDLYAENARWSQYKTSIWHDVPQPGRTSYEEMKTYKSMEDSIDDFALIMLKHHPELNGMSFEASVDLIENHTGYTANSESGSDMLKVGNTISKCYGHVD